MAVFSLDIPDEVVSRVFAAFCALDGYDPESGLTPAEFSRQRVIAIVRSKVDAFESQQAAMAAASAQSEATRADLSGIV